MKLKYYKGYCKDIEKVENYEMAAADNFIGWICHHRLETHHSDGERRLADIKRKELIALDMYLNRPAEELIFLTKSEHISLHNKGKPAWNRGKKHSKDTKKRLSEAAKNRSEEIKKKIGKARKGMHWYNNGKVNKLCYKCPEGFAPGRLR